MSQPQDDPETPQVGHSRCACDTQGLSDLEAMELALELARVAFGHGDVPVGAVVLDKSRRVIGCGYNRRHMDGDPLAHAEVIAIKQASQADGGGAHPSCHATRSRSIHRRMGMDPATPLRCAQDDGGGGCCAQDDGHERWNLSGCTLVVSLEPCPMCAGAALQTHVERIVFGAWDAKLGACGSVWDILRDPHVGHQAQVIGGLMRERSEALLSDFFDVRRHHSDTENP